ncbi:squalene epoxidase-like protein [Mycena haematopus]|nr:squalene epoxidase-like protein [Mycena haematopus]
MWTTHYDVLIVGAGVAGSTLAHALSTLPRSKPLRIALLERPLTEPDQIVGQILQPGGVSALEGLGLASCLENIDATHRMVEIPYPRTSDGRSFHHGTFIMNLRDAARRSVGVDFIEATVTELIQAHFHQKIIGVNAIRTDCVAAGKEGNKATFLADLVVVADGACSSFRSSVMGQVVGKPLTSSHCVGLVLEDVPLPLQERLTVVLVKGSGPVLLHQISKHHTQMIVDITQTPVPSDLKSYILTKIVPRLPLLLRCSTEAAIAKGRLMTMPNLFLPAIQQGTSLSAGILLGDAWNMRHPLTSGGMTVVLNDVVILSSLLGALPNFKDHQQVNRVLRQWHWRRKAVASTVNITSAALYNIFTGDDEDMAVLKSGCAKYFKRGGDCINAPVSLLTIVNPSLVRLLWHFFALTFYSILALFTNPRETLGLNGKPRYVAPSFDEYPMLLCRSINILRLACRIFIPPIWSEIRWWAPHTPPKLAAEPAPRMPTAATESVTLIVYLIWFTVPMVLWTSFIVFSP